MLKKVFLIILLLSICGCSNKIISNVGTIIEEDTNYIIGINYPITNTKIDKIIKKEISSIYQNFKKNHPTDKIELNIDYEFHHINEYLCIVLYIYESDKEQTDIKTFIFDSKKNKLLSIQDITDDTDIIEYTLQEKKLEIKQYPFIFDQNQLKIYVNTEIITIPLNDLELKINIKNESDIKKVNIDIQPKIINPDSKMIALTFDDGPSKYTEEILNILKKNECNATFFVLGNKVSIYSDLLIESINNGNEIGNHSYNHKWMIKLNEKDLENQISKTQDIIKEYTGYTPKLIRPTYGSLNDRIKKISSLDIVLWNVDTLDWKYKNPNKIVENATKKLKDGNIILMHDTHKQTLEALPKILKIIQKNGYTCVTISELKEANFLRKKMNG